MKKENFKNKNTYLWGTGTEGQAIISWWKTNLPNQNLGIIENNEIPNDAEIIIKSPGVSAYLPQISKAKKDGIIFTSLMNIFLENLQTKNTPKTIAISGTKGKSTSVSMLSFMLEKLGKKVGLGGNIGTSPLNFLEQDLEYIVLELSSFQIYDINQPIDIAMVTNISQAHTDWHISYENYRKDKLKIVDLAKTKILDFSDECLKQIKKDNVKYYNSSTGFYVSDSKIFENGKEILLPKLQIIGDHNLSNLCGVLTILKELNLDYKKAIDSLKDFSPLEHRFQKVYEKNGLTFINDSIATVAESTIAGINSCKEDIAVIIGGYDNGPDYSKLNEFINKTEKLKFAICLPDTGRMLKGEKCIQVDSMEQAISTAIEKLDKGTILLSPAAPSFNMYKNYKERGDDFTNLAKKLCEAK